MQRKASQLFLILCPIICRRHLSHEKRLPTHLMMKLLVPLIIQVKTEQKRKEREEVLVLIFRWFGRSDCKFSAVSYLLYLFSLGQYVFAVSYMQV